MKSIIAAGLVALFAVACNPECTWTEKFVADVKNDSDVTVTFGVEEFFGPKVVEVKRTYRIAAGESRQFLMNERNIKGICGTNKERTHIPGVTFDADIFNHVDVCVHTPKAGSYQYRLVNLGESCGLGETALKY